MVRYLKHLVVTVFVFYFSHAPATASEENGGFSFDLNYRSLRISANVTHNLVVIPMRINDSPPLNFILDTGVNTTILTEPMIAYLFDLEIDELVYVLGLGDEGVIEAGMSHGLTFKMEGITGQDMSLIILPEGILSFSEFFGFPVHGIIGHDFFKEFPVLVNYRREFIRVYREPTYRIRRRSAVVPLTIENNKPYADISLQGRDTLAIDSLRLLIDMGATSPLFLNARYNFITPERVSAYLGKGISGELMGEMGRLDHLKISDFTFEDLLVAYPQEEFLNIAHLDFDWEGILGGGLLSRFHVIVDYPSEKLVLRKNRKFNVPFQHNPSGMEVIAQGPSFNEFIVHYVRENSVAYEEEIQKGDQIITIDNQPTQRLDLEEVLGYLNQRPGTSVRLEILRENHIYRKRIRLREDI